MVGKDTVVQGRICVLNEDTGAIVLRKIGKKGAVNNSDLTTTSRIESSTPAAGIIIGKNAMVEKWS